MSQFTSQIESLKSSKFESSKIGAEIAVVTQEAISGLSELFSKKHDPMSADEHRSLADALIKQAEEQVLLLLARLSADQNQLQTSFNTIERLANIGAEGIHDIREILDNVEIGDAESRKLSSEVIAKCGSSAVGLLGSDMWPLLANDLAAPLANGG